MKVAIGNLPFELGVASLKGADAGLKCVIVVMREWWPGSGPERTTEHPACGRDLHATRREDAEVENWGVQSSTLQLQQCQALHGA